MTLTQLNYAIVVAGETSLNEAAKKLFISQPSLSNAIHNLEEEVGIEIFRRSKSGIALTPEGTEFIGYARQVVEQYKLLDARYISKKEEKRDSAFPCSIILLRYRLLSGRSVSLIWTHMNLKSMRNRPIR